MRRNFIRLIAIVFICGVFVSEASLATDRKTRDIDSLIEKANNGDVESQFTLGNLYTDRKKYKEAFEWFLKAAKLGYDQAQYKVGIFYEHGAGIIKDYSEAEKWYLKAASQKHLEAQFNLGLLKISGEDVEKNYKEAFNWFIKLAESGDSRAQLMIASLYMEGKGIAKNLRQAFYWLSKSAEQGVPESQFELGILYYKGKGTKTNKVQAYKWFSIASMENYKDSLKLRNYVEKELTKEQKEKGLKLAKDWIEKYTADNS